mgnify:CR=1 FL=1
MSKVAVVYWSSTGNTEAMANAVAGGIKEKGGEAVLHTCEDFDGSKVAEYDEMVGLLRLSLIHISEPTRP